MAQTDPKEDFLQWVHEIVQEKGPKWSLIAELAVEQGYEEDGKIPSSNAIRKRYRRWKEDLGEGALVKDVEVMNGEADKVAKGEEPSCAPPAEKVLPGVELGSPDGKDYHPKQQYVLVDMEQLRRSIWKEMKESPAPQRETKDQREDYISARETLSLIQESMERRDQMLLEQIKQNNTNTDYTVILEMERRMEHQLTKMQERVEALEGRIAALDVADSVDEALKDMIIPGGSFEKHVLGLVSKAIEQRVSGELGSLLNGIQIRREPKPGPGRGKKTDRKAARFSATIDADVYDGIKSLGGVLSQHIEAACELYLRAREGSKKPHTDQAAPRKKHC